MVAEAVNGRVGREEQMARTIKMLSDMNTSMMEVERLDRVGDRLMVTGTMMGNFPAEIYLEPADMLAMGGLFMRVSPLTFMLGLPYFWLRCYWRRPESRGVGARLRGLALSAGIAIAGLCGIAAAVLGVVELVNIAAALLR